MVLTTLYHNESVGLSPPVKYFYWTFYGGTSFLLFMFSVCHVFASVHCCLVVTCWKGARLWSSWCLVMVEWLFLAVPWGCLRFVIVLFPDHTHLLYLLLSRVVSWVRCGTWLYRFLIFPLSYFAIEIQMTSIASKYLKIGTFPTFT